MNNKLRIGLAVFLLLVGIGVGGYYLMTMMASPVVKQPITMRINPTHIIPDRAIPVVEKTNDVIKDIISIATPIVSLLSLIGGVILLYLNIIKTWKEVWKKKRATKRKPVVHH